MSSNQFSRTEIEELKNEIRTMPHEEFFGENLQPLVDDHSRLLSLLTPPPDAAVREAVERISSLADNLATASKCLMLKDTVRNHSLDLRTLLRAVQAPHLGLSALLPDDFSDSKDWRDGDPAERIEWLKSMLTAMREREADAWKQGELSPRLTDHEVARVLLQFSRFLHTLPTAADGYSAGPMKATYNLAGQQEGPALWLTQDETDEIVTQFIRAAFPGLFRKEG